MRLATPCLYQTCLFESGVDFGQEPVSPREAPDGVDPVPPRVVVLMFL